jgi:histidine kinase
VAPAAEAEQARVAGNVNQLADTLGRTEERRRALVADLSHELRTPLATVSGYIDAMQDGIVAPEPELLAQLSDECRQLERLIADLSLVSRLDEGTPPLTLEEVDVAALAEQVTGRLRPQFDATDVAVTVRVTDEGPCVLADRGWLAQILTNLIGNALKYTGAGGRVRVMTGRIRDQVVCTVDDTGCGVAAADLPRLFDRFYCGTTAGGTAGTGIGLTVARDLARAHGGELTVRSDGPGCGATFRLELPAATRSGFTRTSRDGTDALHGSGVS